jgi:maltoporin
MDGMTDQVYILRNCPGDGVNTVLIGPQQLNIALIDNSYRKGLSPTKQYNLADWLCDVHRCRIAFSFEAMEYDTTSSRRDHMVRSALS